MEVNLKDGMKRLVAVDLRIGDVVIEEFGNLLPKPADNIQNSVAIFYCIGNNPQSQHIKKTAAGMALVAGHLPVNSKEVLGAAGDFNRNALMMELRGNLIGNQIDNPGHFFALRPNGALDTFKLARVKNLECLVLHFGLESVEPQYLR